MFNKIGNYCRDHVTQITVLLYSIVFLLLTLPNLVNQNLIGDEPVYIVEGDRYLHQPYSFYHNSGSPMALKVITALPYSVLPLNRTYEPYYKAVFTNVYTVSEFVYVQNKSYARLIIILARIPHELLALVLGISIFLFTKKWINIHVAWIALSLYTFHPMILAHASTANLDIGVTAFCFFSLALWYNYLEIRQPPHWMIPVTGVILGIAQATKISAILLYPVFVLWFIFRKGDRKWRDLVTVIGVSFLSLWAIYLFQVGPILTTDDTPAGIESIYGSIPIIQEYKQQITQFLYRSIFPLGAYLNNFAYQFSHSFYGHTNYLNGIFTDQGMRYYIPVVFTIKNSLLLLIAIVLGAVLPIFSKNSNKRLQYFLWLWIVIVFTWSVQSKIQLGMRYVMPLFPFLFISAAAGIWYWVSKYAPKKFAYVLVTLFIFTYAISTLRVGTAYFTYIGELYQGMNPVDLVFDSDFDWGQDVYRMAELQNREHLYPLYFRTYVGGNLPFEGIKNDQDPGEAFRSRLSGYYAFSHSSLVNARAKDPMLFSYFYSRRPTFIINRVIYVYKVSFNR